MTVASGIPRGSRGGAGAKRTRSRDADAAGEKATTPPTPSVAESRTESRVAEPSASKKHKKASAASAPSAPSLASPRPSHVPPPSPALVAAGDKTRHETRGPERPRQSPSLMRLPMVPPLAVSAHPTVKAPSSASEVRTDRDSGNAVIHEPWFQRKRRALAESIVNGVDFSSTHVRSFDTFLRSNLKQIIEESHRFVFVPAVPGGAAAAAVAAAAGTAPPDLDAGARGEIGATRRNVGGARRSKPGNGLVAAAAAAAAAIDVLRDEEDEDERNGEYGLARDRREDADEAGADRRPNMPAPGSAAALSAAAVRAAAVAARAAAAATVNVKDTPGRETHVAAQLNPRVARPTYLNPETRETEPLFPSQAKARGINYSATVFVDLIHTVHDNTSLLRPAHLPVGDDDDDDADADREVSRDDTVRTASSSGSSSSSTAAASTTSFGATGRKRARPQDAAVGSDARDETRTRKRAAVLPRAAAAVRIGGEAPCPGPAFEDVLGAAPTAAQVAAFRASPMYAQARRHEREFGTLLHVAVRERFPRFQLPLMTRSALCNLRRQPLAPQGNELGGMFFVGGAQKLISPITAGCSNHDFMRDRGEIECRSRHETRWFYSSSNFKLTLTPHRARAPSQSTQVLATIPFVKVRYPVALVLLALGCDLRDVPAAIRTAARDGRWRPEFDSWTASMLASCRGMTRAQALEQFAQGTVKSDRSPASTAAAVAAFDAETRAYRARRRRQVEDEADEERRLAAAEAEAEAGSEAAGPEEAQEVAKPAAPRTAATRKATTAASGKASDDTGRHRTEPDGGGGGGGGVSARTESLRVSSRKRKLAAPAAAASRAKDGTKRQESVGAVAEAVDRTITGTTAAAAATGETNGETERGPNPSTGGDEKRGGDGAAGAGAKKSEREGGDGESVGDATHSRRKTTTAAAAAGDVVSVSMPNAPSPATAAAATGVAPPPPTAAAEAAAAAAAAAVAATKRKQYSVNQRRTNLLQNNATTKKPVHSTYSEVTATAVQVEYARSALHRNVLPHIGLTEDAALDKCLHICAMIWQEMMAEVGDLESDSLDNTGNSRKEGDGMLLSRCFRQMMSHDMRQRRLTLDKLLKKQARAAAIAATTLRSGGGGGGGVGAAGDAMDDDDDAAATPPSADDDRERRRARWRVPLETLFADTYISRQLASNIRRGTWTAMQGSYVRYGVSRTPTIANRTSVISELTQIASSLKSSGKHQSARAIQPTQHGAVCPAETHDGQNCGLRTNMAALAIRSAGSSGAALTDFLLRHSRHLLTTRELVHACLGPDPHASGSSRPPPPPFPPGTSPPKRRGRCRPADVTFGQQWLAVIDEQRRRAAVERQTSVAGAGSSSSSSSSTNGAGAGSSGRKPQKAPPETATAAAAATAAAETRAKTALAFLRRPPAAPSVAKPLGLAAGGSSKTKSAKRTAALSPPPPIEAADSVRLQSLNRPLAPSLPAPTATNDRATTTAAKRLEAKSVDSRPAAPPATEKKSIVGRPPPPPPPSQAAANVPAPATTPPPTTTSGGQATASTATTTDAGVPAAKSRATAPTSELELGVAERGTREFEDANVIGRGIFAGLVLVKVEGAPVAWTADANAFYEEVREWRRAGAIDREVGYHRARPRYEVELRCDADRLLTPRYIYENLWRLRRYELRPSAAALPALVAARIVEYVDAAEAPDCVTAVDERDAARRLARRPHLRLSHMDLDPSFALGYSAALHPYLHKTPAARGIFATGMNRNALGVDPEQRALQKAHQEIWAPQTALCSTAAGRVHGGVNQLNGRNLRVAILTMPSNIDDACTANRAWIEAHGYTSTTAYLVKSQQRKGGTHASSVPTGGGGGGGGGAGGGGATPARGGDRFEMPDERTCAGIKMSDYSFVDNPRCRAAIGSLMVNNTVVIPKTSEIVTAAASSAAPLSNDGEAEMRDDAGGDGGARNPRGAASAGARPAASKNAKRRRPSSRQQQHQQVPLADRLTRRCTSEVWRGPPAFVSHTSRTVNNDGLATVKVELVQVRVPEIGDKFASLHAQKSVIGEVLEPEDMPYAEDGTRPDLVVSPFCMPSRMTVGQAEEMLLGRALMLGGAPRLAADATAFRDTLVDAAAIRRLFAEHGYRQDGRRVMYNPVTGERLEALVMLGPTFYTKQRHLAADKLNTRADTGPVDAITGQPSEGKRRGGGQRFGNMEIDSMVAHGARSVLHSRIPRSSDYLPSAPACMRCRTLLCAYDDARTRRLHCTACGHGRNVYYVATHRAFRVLTTETIGTGVKPGLILRVAPTHSPVGAVGSSAAPSEAQVAAR